MKLPMRISSLGPDNQEKEILTVDISEEDVKQLKIGEKIELLVKGSIGMLQIPPDGTSKDNPPRMWIRVESKTVKGLNVFAKLAQDNED